MPQPGSHTAVVDKIKGSGTDDISLEELSTKLKQDDKNEHSEVCPKLGLDLFAICCLQELPCSCLPAHHCGSPTLHHGRRSSSIRLPAEAAVQRRLLSLLCVSWRNSLDQQKCLKISILLAQQITSLIKVVKFSKSFESKQDPQGLSSYQTQAAQFSIPLACPQLCRCWFWLLLHNFSTYKMDALHAYLAGQLNLCQIHKAFEKNIYSVTQYSTLLTTNSCHCLLCKSKSKHKSLPHLEYKLETCDAGWLQIIS